MREFSEQFHRQIEKQVEDLVAPTPLVASMRAQIESVRRNEELGRSMGFVFQAEFHTQEEPR